MSERTVSRITVPFSGSGAGTAPLTWGQKVVMQDIRENCWTLNTSGAQALPEGTTVEEAAENLGEVMSRFPVLRLRLGTDANGKPCQVVSESGELDVEVVDMPDGCSRDDVIKYGNDLWFEWLLAPFDAHHEWLMRMAVIRHRDGMLYRVINFSHLVGDGWAMGLCLADLIGIGELVPRRDDPRTVDSLELGRREQTPELRRVSDRAMRYWEKQLLPAAPFTFGEPTHPEGRLGKRYWHGRFCSPAAYLAVLAIAERTCTDTSRVLLAIIAIAIGRATGINPFTTKVMVSNRFRPGFADIIAPVAQCGVLTIDVDGTVDEVVTRARRAWMNAGAHAYYDPEQLEELHQRLDRERGYPAKISCRINDRRLLSRPEAEGTVRGAPVSMEQIRAKLDETILAWDGNLEYMGEQAFITIDDRPETVHLQLIWDMTCLTSEQVETLLRGVEEVAIEAAFDDAVPTRVAPGRVPA